MGGPVWLSYGFAAVMLIVAGFCTGQIVLAHRTRRPAEIDSNGMHVVMGIAMAGMLVARLRFGVTTAWGVVFGMLALWFGWQAVRARRGAATSPWQCREPLTHLVECGAMLFMLAVIPRPAAGGQTPSMAMGSAASRWSALALALVVFMLGYVVRLADQLGSRPAVTFAAGAGACGGAGACATAGSLAPRCAMCCRIAMGITMGYMLVLML